MERPTFEDIGLFLFLGPFLAFLFSGFCFSYLAALEPRSGGGVVGSEVLCEARGFVGYYSAAQTAWGMMDIEGATCGVRASCSGGWLYAWSSDETNLEWARSGYPYHVM